MKIKHLVAVFALAALLMGVSFAQAEILFSYDFESLPVGECVLDHDGWVDSGFPGFYENTTIQGTDPINETKMITTGDTPGNKSSGAIRYFDSPLTFTAEDTAVHVNYMVYADHGSCAFGLLWEGMSSNAYGMYGIYVQNAPTLNAYCRTGDDGTGEFSDELVSGHWYEVHMTMDFSQPGGRLLYEYCDLTAGDTEFTTDGTFDGTFNMGIPSSAGVYTANGILTRIIPQTEDYLYKQYLDNISITKGEVPEPSTLALLAAGLVGLLAYAWRKRK